MKKRDRVHRSRWTLLGAFLLAAQPAFSVPTLQLDILGGSYDDTTETIVAPGPVFTLVALLTPKPGASPADIAALLADEYLISAALGPKLASGGDFGAFVFEGETVAATDDMVFGAPPLEALVEKDAGDLPTHGIFETFFSEFLFHFSLADTTTPYNSQDAPGGLDAGGSGAFYAAFDVDMTALDGHALHFDLYNSKLVDPRGPVTSDALDVDLFAPFSHDAEGRRRIPAPASLWLLVPALLMSFGWRRSRSRG